MSTKPFAAVFVLCMALATSAAAQSRPSPDLPVRLTWSGLNQDGYATVTFTNDTSLTVTAWALGINIVRPDGSKVSRPGNRADFWAALAAVRAESGRTATGQLLLPSTPYIQAVKIGTPAEIADFSLFVTALVFEDGTIAGSRADVAMFLATREIDATTADAWRTAFQSAAAAPDRDTAAALLQQAIDGGAPAVRVGVSLKNLAQRAIRDRTDDARFKATLDEALRTADAYVEGGRRHLNPGSPR